jgi:hypothetical protein
VLLLVDLAVAHGGVNPGVPASSLYPPTPAVEFLRGQAGRVAGLGSTLRPDAAMVYGLDDVRGDSPVKVERYQLLYARLAAPDPVFYRPIEHWEDPWVDALGVRWVIGPPAATAPDARWRIAFDGADARVWERPSAQPLVRWQEPGGASPTVVERLPGHWRVRWDGPHPARLVVAETWDAGWRAESAGRRLSVHAWRGALMAVDLPEGAGSVELRYVPVGFVAGSVLSALGIGALVLALVATRKSQRSIAAARGSIAMDHA